MENNTKSRVKTAFLRGVELVKESLEKYNFQTENWIYPEHSFGDNNYSDNYFETWYTGMDWDKVVFLIKDSGVHKHEAVPILWFSSGDSKLDKSDYRELLEIICKIEEGKEHFRQTDFSSFLKPMKKSIEKGDLKFYEIEYSHASQKPVKFYMQHKYTKALLKIVGYCKCGESLFSSYSNCASCDKDGNFSNKYICPECKEQTIIKEIDAVEKEGEQ